MALTSVLSKNNGKKIGVIAGCVVLLVLAVLVAVPYLTARAWKASTLSATNDTIVKINETNADASIYSNKLNPTEDDYAKLAAACEAQNADVKKAKDELKPVGGFAGLDITGIYQKAANTRTKLEAAYAEIIAINNGCISRANAEKEVSTILSKIDNLETRDQIANAATTIRQVADKIKEFAQSADGTQLDKDIAAAFVDLANSFDTMLAAYDSGNNSAIQASVSTILSASARLAKLVNSSEEQAAALQKRADDAVAQLNAATKELE